MAEAQNRTAHTPADTPAGRARQLLSGWRLAAIVLGTSAVLGIAHQLQPITSVESRRQPEPGGDSSGPDLTISDAVITSFEQTGELRYRLRAPRIDQFETYDRAYLSRPDLSISRTPDPPWRVTAARGIVRNLSTRGGSEEEVLLEDDVRMRQRFPDGRDYLLETQSITIFPERQYAETSRDVMITTHAGRTRAVGLEGDLDQGLLKLFSNETQRVHTVILPDQFK
ncbi:MAG: LPS export ABC transporter periplasmic protein LptC [Pseudomonadales bacterium]